MQDEKKQTPLHIIAKSDKKLAITRLLIALKADPNLKDIKGNVPLHTLTMGIDNHKTVKLLLDEHANVTAQNKDFFSPRYYALVHFKEKFSHDIIKTLITYKTDPLLYVSPKYSCIKLILNKSLSEN